MGRWDYLRERVREVIATEHKPVSAEGIANTARTSTEPAGKHLDALDDERFVTTGTSENGGTAYRRSPESLVVE